MRMELLISLVGISVAYRKQTLMPNSKPYEKLIFRKMLEKR